MMWGREFRRALDECIARLSRGEGLQSCLASYPQYADRLEPYLRSAQTLRRADAPQPSASGRQAARHKLLQAVGEGRTTANGAGVAWLPAPLMRMATAGAAVVLFLVAAMGASAALDGGETISNVLGALNLPSPIGGDSDEDVQEFEGVAISVSSSGLALRTDDDIVIFWYTGETEFEDANGEPITWDEVERGDLAFVRAVPQDDTRYFDALTVRLMDGSATLPPADEPVHEPTATPEPEPTPTAEPVDEPVHEPTPEPKPEEPTPPPAEEDPWIEVAFEGKIKSVSSSSFVLRSGDVNRTFAIDGETEVVGFLSEGVFADVFGWKRSDGSFLASRVVSYPVEFWATVVSVSSSSLTVKVNGAGPNVTLHKTAETEIIGEPFANVKVWVDAYKKGDGSYLATRIEVKKAELFGTITAKEGSTYFVSKEATTYTVKTNGSTVFVGDAVVGAEVTVQAYKMGDGTYLAYKITVKSVAPDFVGTIFDMNLEINTIWVDVEGFEKEVCIEFADVIGTLEVGATVEVFVGWTEGGVHFAELVKVIA